MPVNATKNRAKRGHEPPVLAFSLLVTSHGQTELSPVLREYGQLQGLGPILYENPLVREPTAAIFGFAMAGRAHCVPPRRIRRFTKESSQDLFDNSEEA